MGFSRGSEQGVATLQTRNQETGPSRPKRSFCVFGRLCLATASLCVNEVISGLLISNSLKFDIDQDLVVQ